MRFNQTIIDCCKDCSERTIGCHATCPRYAAKRELVDKEKAQRIKSRESEYDFIRYKIKHREIADY